MSAADGQTMSYSGEQTLLVTRPTRLIALRWWSLMVLALIIAGALALRLPSLFSSMSNPTLGSLSAGTILAAFFGFIILVVFIMPDLNRNVALYVLSDINAIQ